MFTDTASSKVTAAHLSRAALLYVRQSTLKQVINNTESAIRQYDLRGRAIALGWAADQITVIDIDQGHSGASAADREGFQQLVAEVSLGRAGIVLGLECSRLARNSADWHQLLGAPRGAAYSCGDGRAPPPGRRSGLVKLEAA
jgi:Resolvase, N terminal domain